MSEVYIMKNVDEDMQNLTCPVVCDGSMIFSEIWLMQREIIWLCMKCPDVVFTWFWNGYDVGQLPHVWYDVKRQCVEFYGKSQTFQVSHVEDPLSC